VNKAEWAAHQMDANSVGVVDVSLESTDIWINKDFRSLEHAMSGRGMTEEKANLRAERYLYPVACALWLQNHEVTHLPNPPSEEYLAKEMVRTAEAVLAAIDPDADVAGEESAD
jgi:hypothetical protein